MNFGEVRQMALQLPEVHEGLSYGTPALRMKRKLMARLHQDGESLIVRCGFNQRDILIQAQPDVYFVTDHYAGHPWVLVHLDTVLPSDLKTLLVEAWRWAGGKP